MSFVSGTGSPVRHVEGAGVHTGKSMSPRMKRVTGGRKNVGDSSGPFLQNDRKYYTCPECRFSWIDMWERGVWEVRCPRCNSLICPDQLENRENMKMIRLFYRRGI